jgi:hypothetical protein
MPFENLKKQHISDINEINDRIINEICYNTINELSDNKLINEYKKCKSVIKEIKLLENILLKYVDNSIIYDIIDEYIYNIIPAGTKGVIRGNKFNYIVKNYIKKIQLDIERFDIFFEKKCNLYLTTEIPDWYILDKTSNRIIIGMNQLDIWSGGQQLNRGYKYIDDNKHNTNNSKLLCVICNKIQFKNKNKAYKLFEIGFRNNTLCYLNNLENIIKSYFQLLKD